MKVQTDLKAGGRYSNCGKCGSLIYIDNDVAFNVNVQLGLVNFNSQHAEAE